MKYTIAIKDAADSIALSCETIKKVVTGMSDAEDGALTELKEAYEPVLLNALENVQHLVIELTGLVNRQIGDQTETTPEDDAGNGSVDTQTNEEEAM